MTLEYHKIIDRPIVTEESQILRENGNHYVFRVNPAANKKQIGEAVEEMYRKEEIKVVAVRTMNCRGKSRRQFGTRLSGRRAHWKKAIVTLRDGDSIEFI
ncbi:MAG TPA: 50S ribosomal protein L23 [Candidatus Hydrogenedentes bacterium]|jgi:large subunit ribosomal protein L23|nr:MAG: 50S ribosomal protein L23 [Candidatus Hydrogenedentes bacterium ADurb.Bin170]HNZ49238.1 50S ribosomal protein L23 [Candidatus Hydrogenedentota bacterium]HOD95658.1 50S ribosomal protein L23 [Candidatus Hydrogenedentota bacterium]HOH43261.1 50S ribosomal protein L23 [Candidatus Hydrogenedentota bacterium]HOM48717.1 50S ribosomal protein L23 [Candidatus Hydrogenedentota bacterium]